MPFWIQPRLIRQNLPKNVKDTYKMPNHFLNRHKIKLYKTIKKKKLSPKVKKENK